MKTGIITMLFVTASIAANAQAKLDSKDEKFITTAAQGGLLEVKLGQLALTNASASNVKELGQMMVDDHTRVNGELKDLASRKGIMLPSGLSSDGQKKYDELSKKKGADFDKAYTSLMVKDHKTDISEFKEEGSKGSDADLKTWTNKILPVLEHHLQMSEDACKKGKNKKDM